MPDPRFQSPSTNPFGLTNVGQSAAPTFVDIDGDGDLDAFVGERSGNTLFYRNTGSASAPTFAARSTNPFGLTDVGTSAAPTFVDIDGDGDLDAFVGNNAGNTLFYRNTGSASAPTFAAPSTNPFGLTDVGSFAAPTFVDIDGDGDLDAFVGNNVGNTLFYRNTGSASAPTFAAPSTNPFGLTDVGNSAAPTFVDIDGDGDLDAFVGNSVGNTLFYRNTGSASAPTFAAPSTNPFGLTDVGSYAAPTLVDIDGDGDLDAFVGNSVGNTLFYRNITSLEITPSTLIQDEGNSGTTAFTFTVTRSGNTTGSSSASWAVTGTGTNQANATDFVGGTLPSGTVNFAANETSKTITVNVSGDTDVELNEGFTVTLSNPTNATITTATATGTILNDDTALAITPSTLSQNEGNTGTTAFTFTVTRSGNITGSSSASWAVTGSGTNQANATDFVGGTLPSGTVNFAANETSKTITVNVSGDTTVESDEGFTVTLSSPTNATITTATATGTITNDDTNEAPVITSSNSATVRENAPSSTLIYTATATDADGPVNQIVWSLGGNDASAFTIGSNNGEVRLKASADYETKSSYSIDVIATDQNGSGLSTNKTVSIGVIDQAVFSINNVTVNENAGTAIFTVTATDPISNGTSTATVNYATANLTAFGSANGDYLPTNGSLSFSTGDSSKTISVVINDDTLYEPTPETFSVNLSNPTNGAIANSTGTGTINDNDSLPIISAQPSQVLEGNSGTTTQLIFQVSLSARSGQDVSVDYRVEPGTATAGNDYVSTNGTLRLTAGTLSGTITVLVQGDTDVEPDETLTLILSNPVGTTISSGSITGKIINDDTPSGVITLTGTSGKDNLSGNPAAPPTTVPDEVFRGLEGDDNLFGYFGTNTFEGGPGADNLLGYSGKDTFVYPSFSDSLLNSMDTITRFSSTEGDRLQLSSLPSKLSYAGVITATSLSNATSQAYVAANLQANESLLFRYGSSYYLSVNDGTAAFNGTADLLVKFGSLLNAPTTAGTLNVNDYFTI
ncbi:Calx-beta domain-containing protein [Microcystis aeruginosa]|uniref:Serralysin A n=1 Tax=Microcystis aeruginosa NIES-2521 TaxID=2303983 RepID=A0A5A5RPB8_MICAE|nr:Calx-beta domain-containing protein [Microcystis aeruginosa]GCA78394.1 serralysin A [Microcystis aeruginosa NIES-2521]